MHNETEPFDHRFPIDPRARGVPFRRELSLAPLVALWRAAAAGETGVRAELARVVEDALRSTPELLQPIADLAVLERHRELVDVLMAQVFPPASWDVDCAAAILPFGMRPFHATPEFRRLLVGEDGLIRGRTNLDAHLVRRTRLMGAYEAILRQHYGIALPFEYPVIVTITDPDSGLERHFKMHFERRFLEAQPVGELPVLGDEERRRLRAGLLDPDALLALLPPDRFVFRGFVVFKALDVTDQEVLSSLERELIDRESIVSPTRFRSLQDKLCTLLRRSDLQFALAAVQGEQVLMLGHGRDIQHRCIFADSIHHDVKEFAGSVYERAVQEGQPLIIEDLRAWPDRTVVEERILDTGLRSLVIAPLHYQDRLIGTLELASPEPGALTPTNALKLREVLPLFSMAVKRSVEELNARIQAVIKEKCTAIHPSVEWRFRQAVLRGIERRQGAVGEMEEIVFPNVYPLYAISDIRGSSTERNAAIQADLAAQLGLAREVVVAAHEARALPVLDELVYRIDRRAGQIEHGLGSGDEVATIAFLRQHVEPRLDHLAGFAPVVHERVEAYRAALDPQVGTVYRRRRGFEESVTRLNEAMTTYLDAEEALAQQMFPHYFEKQRTDGVDYGIYVGASLVENGVFDELYLRNLRLWQLMVQCGIARETHRLQGRLAIPLDTAHLVLVQHAPLAIRFRFDEKRFDVDGAYNVRYEVVKKRIDKAVVRGTRERVTQPGKIAIVYAHAAEGAEYREYADYLRATGHLTGATEELELEELQGVQGLRALRVTVDLGGPLPAPRAALAAARGAVPAAGR